MNPMKGWCLLKILLPNLREGVNKKMKLEKTMLNHQFLENDLQLK